MSIRSRALHILTNLAILLPATLVTQTAFADACPSGLALYGEWAGGFCCNGTVGDGGGYCIGTVCALDPTRTQGAPLCYEYTSTTCRNMGSLHYYGGIVGGFCCDAALGADKNTCTGNICALDASRTQGYPMCEPMEAQCPTGTARYGEWAGGFCCNGTVGEGWGSCYGTACALDPSRSQGAVLCPSVMPACPEWRTRYGESAGGFCCEGTVASGGGSCNGNVCALDPARTQGNPLCDSVAPTAQGTQGGMTFFSSIPEGAEPFRLFAAAGSVQTTANGVSISGDVTVSGGEGQPEIALANADIDLTFDSNGYLSTLIGTASASLPSAGGLSMDDLGTVTLGLDWGENLNNPQNPNHVEAPMKDDRQYLVLHVAAGLSGSYGPVSFSAPGGMDTLIVVDPRDLSVYFHGDLSGLTGLEALDNVGIGVSVQGLLPFEHENTWGISDFADDFDGHIVIEGPIPLPPSLPLSAEGQMTVRLPSSGDPFMRIGMNSELSLGIEFVPNVADFSFVLGNATVGGHFNASPASGEVYFSAYAGTQGFIDALPDVSVMPTVGVHVAGRLSTIAANNYLRVAGNGSFQGYQVTSLDMRYSPVDIWASGHFQLGGGFWANLSGKVMPTYADLKGEGYVQIPIYGAKEIVGGTYQAVNYIKNGAECGYTTAANAAECGWQQFTGWFCTTFPWLCTAQPATCQFQNSCTKDVWVQQTIQEPHFNYGAFTAKAQFQVSSPNNVTVHFTDKLCPPYVGSCSVGAEDLSTATPKVCVTSSLFGKFCQPMAIHSASN